MKMNHFHNAFLIIVIVLVFSSCAGSKDHPKLEFVPFEELSYKIDSVEPGTAVQLIAYSGGQPDNDKEIYYHQFIGVNKKTNDTMRILVSLISFTDENSSVGKTHAPVFSYSADKRLSEAELYPQDSTVVLMQNLSGAEYSENTSKEINRDVSSLMEKIKRKQFIVINKDMDLFQLEYKTVIGVLHFTEKPWD